ncbi:hypothetical protein DKX38_005730 [Salix brachista]|uniref:Uncharacterized protein n=1 Tax=Salix brachista TaxID=2182728 RepID=A0A5N5N2D0_9ROSI|nr:hypothetical protein DKX38_005730 [Salix brachista]
MTEERIWFTSAILRVDRLQCSQPDLQERHGSQQHRNQLMRYVAVLDIVGEELKADTEYYILPVLRGGGGGLTMISIGFQL